MGKSFDPTQLEKLNAVSPSFCLAKWLQVTVDLVQGMTHSCHHPKRHLVPLEEIARNPGALHNTQYKKEQRKKMLSGERPSECSYCWDMEDLGNQYSDRYIKSTDPWSWELLDKVKSMPWDADVNPTYLEVMLDKTCNFSCAYCMADISSSIEAEMKKFGPYPGFSEHHRLPPHTFNEKTEVYREAFFKWLPDVIGDLKVLRLTGGEPLLSKHFWNLLERLKTLPSKNLHFIVNSHLSHPPALLEKFLNEIESLKASGKIKDFSLYVSLDTYQDQAEYIRSGLQYQRVLKNLEVVSQRFPDVDIVLMCTFNILSIARFTEFLKDVLDLKKKLPIFLDISYLRAPEYLRADLADSVLGQKVDESLRFMEMHVDQFTSHEISKFRNVVKWIHASEQGSQHQLWRAGFFKFVTEYDRRKQKHFLSIFPEYSEFFKQCKKAIFDRAFENHGSL